jgi:hypothetical protein
MEFNAGPGDEPEKMAVKNLEARDDKPGKVRPETTTEKQLRS